MKLAIFAALLGLVLICALHTARAELDDDSDDDNDTEMLVDNNNTEESDVVDDDDDDYNPREALLNHLLSKQSPWSKKVPPPARYLPVQVQVKMRPLHIDSVCTKTYHIKLPVLESYNWTDPRLAWNESDFGGIKSIPVDAADIWMPDIGVYQSGEGSPTQIRPKQFRPIVNSDGTVLFMPRTKYIIACSARTWLMSNVSANNITASGDANGKNQSATQDIGTFACEFDQGSWTHDLSTVDIIPIVGGGLATTKADKKVIKLSQQQQPSSSSKQQKQQKSQQKSKPRANTVGKTKVAREYTAKEYNATTDLSWFESNQLYDIQAFEAKRVVMQYPAMGTEEWPSMHYRLVINVKQRKYGKKSDDNDDDDDYKTGAPGSSSSATAKDLAAPIIVTPA